jgi:hypothetical protein
MTACTVKNTSPYPIYEIDLNEISSPIEISAIVKEFGTEKYVYTFEYNGEIIKYGISVDKKSIPGERIYRQAGHLMGWSKQLAPGSAGTDMRDIDTKYYTETGANLNRHGMSITVHDLTNVESPSIADENFHVKQLERKLLKEYTDQRDTLPIGNIKDESYIDNKTCVERTVWNKLFAFELFATWS